MRHFKTLMARVLPLPVSAITTDKDLKPTLIPYYSVCPQQSNTLFHYVKIMPHKLQNSRCLWL